MKSRSVIDKLFEEKGEQAQVTVQLTGTPSSVQKALTQLGKKKSTGGKSTTVLDLAKSSPDLEFDVESPKAKPVSKDEKPPEKE